MLSFLKDLEHQKEKFTRKKQKEIEGCRQRLEAWSPALSTVYGTSFCEFIQKLFSPFTIPESYLSAIGVPLFRISVILLFRSLYFFIILCLGKRETCIINFLCCTLRTSLRPAYSTFS
jgi:hypothetical protein